MAETHGTSPDHEQKKYHFFVDGTKWTSNAQYMSGAEIKKLAGVQPDYQLFQEQQGDDPDAAISDGQTVDLANPPKHFYAVPAATFGAR